MKFFLVFILVFAMSCTKTVLVDTVPSGAKVYVDEKYIGESPVRVEANAPPSSGSKLRLEKEGYFTEYTTIPLDREITKINVNLKERGNR